ncbi:MULTISPECIES: small secreted protein [Streptomyces]|uniref:small secreted protein n=1 Tax=Streptomyces TaxID=1883 RepID=UPI001D0579AB|nr:MULTISPECIES: small secreted protein [Streptomyces]
MKKKLPVALSVVTGCAAMAFTLTACGGDDSGQADEWAQSVCDQVRPQAEAIQRANTAIAEASEGDLSAEEVQEADAQAFQDISDAYGSFADAVDSAGDPPVDDGAQLREDAVTELRGISEAYGQLRETMDGLDTSDQGAFAEGLQEIAGQLRELGERGDEALNEIQSGELGEAMGRQEGCQSPSAPSETEGDQGEGAADEGAEDEGAEEGGEEGAAADEGSGDNAEEAGEGEAESGE